ncbi:GTP 3',8-cyclase MoaA [[Eubacterium] cellulosolvens]
MDGPQVISEEHFIRDRFHRPIVCLRISVTSECNLRCFYCHGEGQESQTGRLTIEEIGLVCRVASGIGIRKVKITGGEPLLRHDIEKVVSAVSSIRGIEEVSMTTNGILMAPRATDLVRAGLRRANISLPSIDPRVYCRVTGTRHYKARSQLLSRVVDGIDAAIAAGLSPLKINMVVLKGLNDHEIPRMIEFSREKGAVLQLIELQNLGIDRDLYRRYHNDLRALEKWLAEQASKIETRRLSQNRKRYTAFGTEIEVVRPMENDSFCAACTKIRVSADGSIKPCLMRTDNSVPIPNVALATQNEALIRQLFKEAIKRREPFFVSPKIGT